MSTRGVFGVLVDGQTKAVYNHSDSYPQGLGVNVLRACSRMREPEQYKIAKRHARAVNMVHPNGLPTNEQLRMIGVINTGLPGTMTWETALKGAEHIGPADIIWGTAGTFVCDSSEFLGDALFCEWAYIVNFDECVVEVHVGGNRDWSAPGRYVNMPWMEKCEYAGVRHVLSIPFDELPVSTASDVDLHEVAEDITRCAENGITPNRNWIYPEREMVLPPCQRLAGITSYIVL